MESLEVDEGTFRKLEERAKEKDMTITDYVASLVPSARIADK